MEIVCKNCNASYYISEDRIPLETKTGKCKKCDASITVLGKNELNNEADLKESKKMANTQQEFEGTNETPVIDVVKATRVRKITITPACSETSLALSVEVIGHGTLDFSMEVSELPPLLLNQLAIRGITNFIHDKTAGAKDVSTIPSLIEGVFTAVKDGTIFMSARQRSDEVKLPLTVQAVMVRDKADLGSNAARQEALNTWNALSEEDKRALRQDSLLMHIVTIINAREAEKALAEAGIQF